MRAFHTNTLLTCALLLLLRRRPPTGCCRILFRTSCKSHGHSTNGVVCVRVYVKQHFRLGQIFFGRYLLQHEQNKYSGQHRYTHARPTLLLSCLYFHLKGDQVHAGGRARARGHSKRKKGVGVLSCCSSVVFVTCAASAMILCTACPLKYNYWTVLGRPLVRRPVDDFRPCTVLLI